MANFKKNNLKNIKKELEDIIESERRKVEVEKASLAGQIEEINRKIARMPVIEKRLAEIRDELAHLVFLKKEKIIGQRELYSSIREIKRLEKLNYRIEKEGKILANKVNLLSSSGLSCPICERKLTNPYKAMLLGEFRKIYKEKRQSYQKNLKAIKIDQKRIKVLEDKNRESDIILLGREELEKQKLIIINEIEETKKVTSELPKLSERQQYLAKELEKKSFAPLTQKMLQEIKKNESKPEDFI
jgi:hypothetical protein